MTNSPIGGSDLVPFYRDSVQQQIPIIWNRATTEPRSPMVQRIPYSPLTKAGTIITPDRAMTISAVWRCIQYLCQAVGKLPWRVMKKTGTNSEIQIRHPVDWLLNKRPSSEWSSLQFRETLLGWALRWGNGYAEIERSVDGRPFALHPIHPERVIVMRDTDTGELFYAVTGNTQANPVILDAIDMFHLRGFGEGPVGVNVIKYAAESLGWAKAAQMFGSAFFGNGAQLAGIVTMKKPMSMEAMEILRHDFTRIYGGSRQNSVAFLDNEMEYQSIAVEPEKGQFIETNEFLIDEICRWFGVPPHKVFDLRRATFNNIEFSSHEAVDDGVEPWTKRFQDEADYKLFGQNRSNLYTNINLKPLKQVDTKTRMEYYQGLRNIGAINTNEIRDFEDLNSLPDGKGGDKYTMQSGMTTLDKIGADPEPVQPDLTPEEQQAVSAIYRKLVVGNVVDGNSASAASFMAIVDDRFLR